MVDSQPSLIRNGNGRNFLLRDRTRRKLQDWILTGQLKPGTKISESTLAAKLHVSRTPMREALLKVEHDGFVVLEGARGYTVAPLDAREVREIYPILSALECLALETAGSRVTNSLSALRQINRKLAKPVGTPANAVKLDTLWHETLIKECPNKRLLRLVQGLKKRAYRYERNYMLDRSLVPVSIVHHDRIIAALEGNNMGDALKYLIENWRFGMESVLKKLDWA